MVADEGGRGAALNECGVLRCGQDDSEGQQQILLFEEDNKKGKSAGPGVLASFALPSVTMLASCG